MNNLRSSLVAFTEHSDFGSAPGYQPPERQFVRVAPSRKVYINGEDVSAQAIQTAFENVDVSVMPGLVGSENVLTKYAEKSSNAWIASRWKQHLFSVNASTDVDAISETIEWVFEAVSRFGPASIDLGGVASNNVNAEHLVAVLRATYSSKGAVPGWRHALHEAKDALNRVGLVPAEVLEGLS